MKKIDWRYASILGILGLIFVGLTLVSTIVAQPSTAEKELIMNRSVYNHRPSGYADWYAVMQGAGVHMEIWRNRFENLDELPPNAVMLIIEPYTAAGEEQTFGADQVRLLLRWVRTGHTAILIDDFERTGSQALLSRAKLRLAWEKALPQANQDSDSDQDDNNPDRPFYHVRPLEAGGLPTGRYISKDVLTEVPARFSQDDFPTRYSWLHDIVGLSRDTVRSRSNPAFIRMGYGHGQLVLGTLTDLADNSFLQNRNADDNYQFLSNIVLSAAQGRPIYINEYVHYGTGTDLLDYYAQKTPLGKILAQLVLIFMAMLWLSFAAWKPRPRAARSARQVPLSGFIESMAGIYYRGRAASLALSPRLDEIERTLRKRYRMSLNDTARVRGLLEGLLAGYSDKASRSGAVSGAVLADALQKARQVAARRQSLPHPELLKLSQQLSLVQEALLYGNVGIRTKD